MARTQENQIWFLFISIAMIGALLAFKLPRLQEQVDRLKTDNEQLKDDLRKFEDFTESWHGRFMEQKNRLDTLWLQSGPVVGRSQWCGNPWVCTPFSSDPTVIVWLDPEPLQPLQFTLVSKKRMGDAFFIMCTDSENDAATGLYIGPSSCATFRQRSGVWQTVSHSAGGRQHVVWGYILVQPGLNVTFEYEPGTDLHIFRL